jgi:membrane-associated phospholipid phosphatase
MLDLHKYDGLSQLGDMKDDYNLPYLGSPLWDNPFVNLTDMTIRDWGKGGSAFGESDTWNNILIGTGVTLASSLLDRRVADWVGRHATDSVITTEASIGKYMPYAALGGAGLAALTEKDQRLNNTGLAALEASGTGLLIGEATKYAVGRARPIDGLGPTDFEPFKRSSASFPSNHVIVAWGAITPFAEEYEAPWLYSIAALTNVGRIASQEHWVSDTVAGSFIGYWMGKFFWEQNRKNDKGPRIGVTPNSVNVTWKMD